MERRLDLGHHKNKIMIIEDDPSMVSLLATLLKMEGFTVRTPKNHQPDHLLNIIIDEQPHVALVDVNLSMGSGLDLVKEIRREPRITAIFILMISGLDMEEECIRVGADGFVMKPFMPDELISLIHKTLNPLTELQK